MAGGFAALFTGLRRRRSRTASPASPRSATQQYETLAFSVAANTSVLLLILGIIGMTQEYRHRTATPTFLTEPRRGRVIAAKLIAYALVAVPFALLIVAVNVLVVTVYAGARGAAPSLNADNLQTPRRLRARAGGLRGDRRGRRRPAPQPGRRHRRRRWSTCTWSSRSCPAIRRPAGRLQVAAGRRRGGHHVATSRRRTCSSRGRAPCCCSDTVCSRRSWARSWLSGATSSERGPVLPLGATRRA